MTYLLIITLASSPIPSPHNLFDIILLGLDAVSCHDQEIKIQNFERHKAANLVAHA